MTRLVGMALLGLGLAVGAIGGTQLGEGHRAVRAAVAQGEAVPVVTPAQRVADWWGQGGLSWLFGCALVLGGAVLARRGEGEAGAGAAADQGAVPFREALEALDAEIATLQREAAEVEGDAPELRDAIDALRAARIDPLIANRAAYAQRHGLAAYANTFGALAAVERNLARAWSAFTDAHAPTARDALDQARAALGVAAAADEASGA